MNQMMCKEINVNTVRYKTLTTTNFYSKSMRSLFKSVKNKKRLASPVACRVGKLSRPGQYGLAGSKN